jgi:hypothetical protein
LKLRCAILCSAFSNDVISRFCKAFKLKEDTKQGRQRKGAEGGEDRGRGEEGRETEKGENKIKVSKR